MTVQWILVALVVAGSFAYTAWALMPQALRRVLLAVVRQTPLRALLGTGLSLGVQGAAGVCGSCGSCASSASKPAAQRAATKGGLDAPQAAPLHFVPMARRR